MSLTMTLTTTKVNNSTAVAFMEPKIGDGSSSEFRARRIRRRQSAPSSSPTSALKICRSLSHSIEALDLSSASPIQTLASLRYLVLTYLADLERRLSDLESPTFESWKAQGESKLEEAKNSARAALEMLEGIRTDVCSHIPEFPFADLSSMESFVKSHLPDLPEVPDLSGMRSHLPAMPHLPDMTEMRSHLSDMRHKFDDVRTRFHEIDFQQPLGYIPTLSDHLETLHLHLSNLGLSQPFAPSTILSDLLDALLNSEVVSDILDSSPDVVVEGEDIFERAAFEAMAALRKSLEGVHLIGYSDLPEAWKNNPFVTHGYRFIPIERWPLLIRSLFAFHNETLNIHTHLIPFFLWSINLIPLFNTSYQFETPEVLFMSFALLCLFSSALWHTMSGCADHRSMEFCARVDYIGIGWLISASVGTIVHYGFQCHPNIRMGFLALCGATGLAGNIFPFMDWFNQHQYRFYRIGFFLSLAFSGIAPMVVISILHSTQEMYQYISPVFPSLLSYLIGLFFYAYHLPERILPESVRHRLDMIGGGSHAIWHCFIVLAVSQHKTAIQTLKHGLQCLAH